MSNTSKKTVGRPEVPARRVRRPNGPTAISANVTDDQVARLAYQYYEESGCVDGYDLEHWLRAESELRGR